MASEKLQGLQDAGIDVEGALSRLMNNEGFFLKMLGKFIEDKTYQSLETAYEAKDMQGVLHAAHALKGVSSNLGMTRLSDLCGQMQHMLEGKEDGDVDALMAGIRESYSTALAAAQAATGA